MRKKHAAMYRRFLNSPLSLGEIAEKSGQPIDDVVSLTTNEPISGKRLKTLKAIYPVVAARIPSDKMLYCLECGQFIEQNAAQNRLRYCSTACGEKYRYKKRKADRELGRKYRFVLV